MFTVDVEFKSGVCIKPQFLTQREAVAYAGRMAQDSAVKLSAVRGLDAKDGGPGSGPNPNGGGESEKKQISLAQLKSKLKGMSYSDLNKAYANKSIDPGVREEIGKEMDRRPSNEASAAFR